MELNDIKSYNKLMELDPKLAVQVKSVYDATKETINSISGCYNNYTMHDTNHGFRVACYMENIAFGIDDEFENNISRFNAFELALLILSALLHDIGMFIRPEDREQIKSGHIRYNNTISFEGMLRVTNNNENEAIKEIIRITHAQRIKDFINYDFNGFTISKILCLDDKYPYSDDVVEICVSHGENYDYLKALRKNATKGNYTYNLQFLAAALRIADYLDLDKQRTPILWFRMMNIEGFSREEWEKHFIIHNEKKIKRYIDDKYQVFFEGKSSNAKIHRKYLRYIDELKNELENTDELLNTQDTDSKYKFRLSTKIDDNVITEGFKYSDLRLNLDYQAITNLLMGKNIYGNNKLGLRELIQNAIDACELMKEKQASGAEVLTDPQITILISKRQNYVKIKDTGIGMTLNVVKKHFLNIGKSYYKSNEYYYENYHYQPIGQYGIGFLACFLLSDNVIVKTKYYNSSEINQIELEKDSEYVVTNIEETGTFIGTEIILDYKKFFSVFSDKADLIAFLEKYFFTTIPIRVRDLDGEQEYTVIKNSSYSIITARSHQTTNSKYTVIDCKGVSDEIKGKLLICDIQPKRSFDIKTLFQEEDTDYYILDKKKNVFNRIVGNPSLEPGYYNTVDYRIIEDEEAYNKIVKSRKKPENKRAALLSIGKKALLIIPYYTSFEYSNKPESMDEAVINQVPISTILKDSNLPYYKELTNEYVFYQDVFIWSNKMVNLQMCHIGGSPFYRDSNREYDFSFFFYNKGVWINRISDCFCLLPLSIMGMGVINYNGSSIRLDVSRNTVISDMRVIHMLIANIILNNEIKRIGETEQTELMRIMVECNTKWIEKNKSETEETNGCIPNSV